MADFFREKRAALVAYVRRRIDDAADQEAEDIVQDVLTGLFDRADPTIPIQNLAAFVYRSLRNRIIDRFRRRRETLPLLEEVLGSGGDGDPVLEFERRETLEAVFAALEGLSPAEREVILATELEGRTFKELAAEWKVPLGTLLARKSRGLEKIREHLTGRSI
ncbi:MAG: RNA polymerase sigma factor [Candidatus Aminicenantes bacterium]|nr:RNA polymerase sigma factor [Candidatus Aminicenantes bacterium]